MTWQPTTICAQHAQQRAVRQRKETKQAPLRTTHQSRSLRCVFSSCSTRWQRAFWTLPWLHKPSHACRVQPQSRTQVNTHRHTHRHTEVQRKQVSTQCTLTWWWVSVERCGVECRKKKEGRAAFYSCNQQFATRRTMQEKQCVVQAVAGCTTGSWEKKLKIKK